MLGLPQVQDTPKKFPQVCLEASKAAAYCGCTVADLNELEGAGGIMSFRLPIGSRRLFLVADLDALLQESDETWQPLPQYGRKAELGTFEAAKYLDIPKTVLRDLARNGLVPHTGGGKPGIRLLYRAGELKSFVRTRAGK